MGVFKWLIITCWKIFLFLVLSLKYEFVASADRVLFRNVLYELHGFLFLFVAVCQHV